MLVCVCVCVKRVSYIYIYIVDFYITIQYILTATAKMKIIPQTFIANDKFDSAVMVVI